MSLLCLKPRGRPPRHAFSGRETASGRLGASAVRYEIWGVISRPGMTAAALAKSASPARCEGFRDLSALLNLQRQVKCQ